MAAESIVLSLAGQRDARMLAQLSRDFIETGLEWSYRPDRIARLIDDDDTVTIVAREMDRTVGFAVATIGHWHAHLVLLAVEPKFRRRGIGRRLVAWLVESAVTAGVASIAVELRAGNAAAFALYRGMGFSTTQRIAGYYAGREPALRMLRRLRP